MSNYTKTTNFATKDNLSPGNPLKIVKGTEIDTEYNNIATAVATKTDNSAAAITGGTIVGITDLAVADGGTGASTAAGALNNLLPSQTSAANKYLQSDGTNASWDAVSLSTADITGTLGVANGGTGVTTSTGTTNVVLSNSPTLVTPALGTPSAAVLTNATGLPISTGVSGLGTGVATFLGTPSSANLISAVTDETGTGALVFATSPTLITPALGTPASGVATNLTGLPISTGVSGLGAGIATLLATPSSANLASAITDETGTGSLVFATSPTLVTPLLGTPTSATLTNATGLPISTGVSGLGTGVATFLATPSSANLLSALTDETGTGVVVFATSPTLVTPILGTPTSATLTNATGLPLTTGVTGQLPVANGGTGTATPSIVAGTNVTVTGTWPNQTIASTAGGSGTVTSVAATVPSVFSVSGSPITTSGTLAMTYSGTALPVANGGTGQTSYTDGQLLIGNTTGSTLTKTTLTAGSGITITNGSGAITIASSGGSGDVVGPASSTANGIALFDGTTGKLLKNSSATDGLIQGLTVGLGAGAVSTNTVVGTGALATNSTGGALVAVGYQALNLNTNSNSTAVGYQALKANTSGDSQVAVGYNALLSSTTAYGCTALGTETLKSQTTGIDNTAAGNSALKTVTTGSSNTAFGSGALVGNTTASYNSAFGYRALASTTTGYGNVGVGYTAGTNITTGILNIIFGFETTASAAGANYEIVIGTNSQTGKGSSTGFISPNSGGVYQGNNSSSWSTTSDQRLKKNIVDNNIGLDKLTQIQVRNFEYRLPEEVTELEQSQAIQKTGVQLGVIAQELQAVLPECVKTESTGVMSVDSDNLTWYMINAIKELKAELDAYKASNP